MRESDGRNNQGNQKSREVDHMKRLNIPLRAYRKNPNNDLMVLLSNDEALAIVETLLCEIHQILELVPLCFSPSKAVVRTKNKEAPELSLCDTSKRRPVVLTVNMEESCRSCLGVRT